MRIYFALDTDSGGGVWFHPVYSELENNINSCLEAKSFGDGLDELFVGIISKKNYNPEVYRIRSPKYERNKKKIEKTDQKEKGNRLSYEFRVEVTEDMANMEKDTYKAYFKGLFLNSINLQFQTITIADFDSQKFLVELQNILGL